MNTDMTSVTTADPSIMAWSSRPYTDADRDAVLRLFTEPDFYFRAAHPDILSQQEILALLAHDTHVIAADGTPVGIYALESVGADHGCHYQLHFRLRADTPDSWWQLVYREIVRALRHRTEVVRLTVQAAQFDHRLIGVLRALGLIDEGILADVIRYGGRQHGYHYFSEIWVPET